MTLCFRKSVSVAYYGRLFLVEILGDGTVPGVGVFSGTTMLTNFDEKHEKLRTIKPNVAIAFEASISRLPAFTEESLRRWWGCLREIINLLKTINYTIVHFLQNIIMHNSCMRFKSITYLKVL